ncbi:MAG TPA: sugar phosphate isomerase/epimerase [Polyangiaceae bacterium]|nr:sugar phosphate isomerase/epimerase [Polyangiaceae bacterium]
MKISLCTISLRHQLISLEQIALFAAQNDFQGIELWGVHAKNLGARPEPGVDWLRSLNLSVSMLSDYLPLRGNRRAARDKAAELCRLARAWGTSKLRTFAGDRPSADVPAVERAEWVARLRELCDVSNDFGIRLVVETHPNTLADTPGSTLQLASEVDHPALRFNFDVIHVWEGGAEPLQLLRQLEPLVAHLHLKNVATRELLSVFAPGNVYAPAGDRAGMVRLFEGAFDFRRFLRAAMTESQLPWEGLDASLEWFGPDVLSTLARDNRELRAFESEIRETSRSFPWTAHN